MFQLDLVKGVEQLLEDRSEVVVHWLQKVRAPSGDVAHDHPS